MVYMPSFAVLLAMSPMVSGHILDVPRQEFANCLSKMNATLFALGINMNFPTVDVSTLSGQSLYDLRDGCVDSVRQMEAYEQVR